MTSLKRASGLLLVLALVLGLQAVAYAQTGAASITGLVTDQSGAAVPGVTVVATNQATNVEYTAVTNATGSYDILSVPVGRYVVKAALSGFKTTSTRPITLEAKQIARIDLKMEVGALEDTVEVTAQAPVLQTETATVGEVLSANTVQSLPLNGRNANQLALLLPGAITPNPRRASRRPRQLGRRRPALRQRQPRADEQLPDRRRRHERDDRQPRSPTSRAPTPSPRSASRRTTTRPTSATSAGAVISNVIKSGANQFRGNVFEFYRNSDFDANTWSNNRSSATKAERTQHIFGATLGGPIVKNKLFFFVDYQGTVLDAARAPRRRRSRPAAWRTGDLSSLLPGTVIRDPRHRAAFPEQPDPARAGSAPPRSAILNSPDYPLPNRDVTGVTGNYVGDSLSTTRAHQGDLRLDWNASANDKLFLRFSIAELRRSRRRRRRSPLLLGAPERGALLEPRRSTGATSSAPSLINEVLVGYNSINNVTALNDWGGIGERQRDLRDPRRPADRGSQRDQLGQRPHRHRRRGHHSRTTSPKGYQLNEKLTWIKGRHALKFGGQFLRYVQQRYYAGNNGALGLFNYASTFTRLRLLRLPARPGVEQGPWRRRPRQPVDAPPEPDLPLRPGRLPDPARPDAEPRPALGLHLAPRREGQPPVELRRGASPRQRDRRADLREGRQHRGPRALQALLQRAGSRASASPGGPPTAGSSAAATASPSTWRARAPTCGSP